MTTIDVAQLLVLLAIGLVAGWLAAVLVRGGGFGLLPNLVLGVVGAIVGVAILAALGVFLSGAVGLFVAAVVGAGILLALLRVLRTA